ncbi:MAG TPA: DUF177 domain-containing protein [Bacteroidales bacterium]|nr:DUF177 domain-containing protein [Bacteroidales bacterium]
MSKYRVDFQGLREGVHEFIFDVDNAFFQSIEYSDIKEGALKTFVVLTKKTQLLELDFKIQGFVNVICDRCLDDLQMPINFDGQIFVKFSENEQEDTEEVMYLLPGDYEIGLAHYIYESIRISLPIKCVHPNDEDGNSTCNPEMLKKIENLKPDTAVEDLIDPRWNDLIKLKNN